MRRTRPLAPLQLGVLIALLSLGAACGADGGTADVAPPPASTDGTPASSDAPTTTTDPAGDGGIEPPLPSPFSAYLLQGSDLYTIQVAEAELAGECMRRFGFEPVGLGHDRNAVLGEQRLADTRLYGITDLATAQTDGYRSPVSATTDGAQGTSPSYNFVYTGDRAGGVAVPEAGKELSSPGSFGGLEIPAGGCRGEARLALWGSSNSKVKDGFAQSLRNNAHDASRADARVQSVFARWATCMRASGFSFQDPLAPEFDRPADSVPTPVEIRTAVADVECKKETDLVTVWNKVDVEYQRKSVEKNQLQLTEGREQLEAGLKRAVAVVGGE